MSFPVSPSNGDTQVLNGVQWTYSASSSMWTRQRPMRNAVRDSFAGSWPNKDGAIYLDKSRPGWQSRIDHGGGWIYDANIHLLTRLHGNNVQGIDLGSGFENYKMVKVSMQLKARGGNYTPMLVLRGNAGEITGKTDIYRHIRWSTGGERTQARASNAFTVLGSVRDNRPAYLELVFVRPDYAPNNKGISGFMSGRRADNDSGQLWYLQMVCSDASTPLTGGRLSCYQGEHFDYDGIVTGYL